MSHVPFSIDLIHNGVNDTILFEDGRCLLESRLHRILLFDQALRGGLLPGLQKQNIYNILHARLYLILDLDDVIDTKHGLLLVIFDKLAQLLEQLE
jgi:hypothetical protein